MATNLPLQSSLLYHGKWSHEIDSTIIGTMLRLKQEYGCDGTVFPSHFIFKAQFVVEYEFELTFEWWELVDPLLGKEVQDFQRAHSLGGYVLERAKQHDHCLVSNLGNSSPDMCHFYE